jgi:hypothetical protein
MLFVDLYGCQTSVRADIAVTCQHVQKLSVRSSDDSIQHSVSVGLSVWFIAWNCSNRKHDISELDVALKNGVLWNVNAV